MNSNTSTFLVTLTVPTSSFLLLLLYVNFLVNDVHLPQILFSLTVGE